VNIFVINSDITKCAQEHVDKHVVKMILETTQLLNNALIKNIESYERVYRLTHKNHPCSLWAAESYSNFEWLNNLGLELCKEYKFRYGQHKVHKCQLILEKFSDLKFRTSYSSMTPFRLCMPDTYKVEGDAVTSYRNYYKGEKAYIAKWSNRNIPSWWNS
jgi:hypothetical protein